MIRKQLSLLSRQIAQSQTLSSRTFLTKQPYIASHPTLLTQQQHRCLFGKSKLDKEGSNKAKKEAEKESTEKVEADNQEEVVEEVASDEQQGNFEEMKAKIEELESAAKVQADLINTGIAEERNAAKRIAVRHTEDIKHSIKPFSKDMISIHDDLTRALQFIPKEMREQHEEVEKMVEGIEMTAGNLEKSFNKHHITKIPAEPGTQFDEKLGHEAVSILPLGSIPDIEAGMIGVQTEVGWKLHDRILRSARVIVVQE